MMEKIVNSMGFMETLLNPMNAPRIYLVYIKSMTQEDKNEIEKVYSSLADLVMGSFKLEIDYSEKEEAEMIKAIVKEWNSVKPSFRKIIASMQNPVSSVTKEKSYFG
jgi:ABC-type transport system involved in cytochrome bd biosynthesis fused ATPase/permease subunit